MLSLDHIVFSGKDLNNESKHYTDAYDIKVIKGGEHERWGTHNYLAYFRNHCYIEWLGINNPDIARQSDNPLIQHLVHLLDLNVEEPFQFALRTTELDEYVIHFQKEKIPFIGPINGQRKKPDGKILTWRLLFPVYDYKKETLPFLIEWDQPEEERIDTNMINDHSISAVHFGGSMIERFATIYQLNQNNDGKFALDNVEIIFLDEPTNLQFQID